VTERTDSWIITAPPPDANGKTNGKVYDVRSGAPGKTAAGVPYESL